MNLGNRVSQHNFAVIPNAQIPRSSFNRSFGRKQTFNADYLVPIFLDEVLPGDTFNLSLTSFARLATPIVPFMDNLYLDYFFFFVPNRLVWNNWQKFNGEQENPGDSTDFLIPWCAETTITVTENTLQNYIGLPKGTFSMTYTPISALPFRAYNLIYNEWFRDQNLQDSLLVDKGDGPDDPTQYVLRKRGKQHDYFTSSLPWPQKGPSVELPLGSAAPIGAWTFNAGFVDNPIADNVFGQWTNVAGNTQYHAGTRTTAPGALDGNPRASQIHPGASNWNFTEAGTDFGQMVGDINMYAEVNPNVAFLQADLSSATAATINQLREAFQIQKLYERDARGGTRYIEIIRSHFGVISPDARLQRPEYLGGGSSSVNVNPIAQTSSTDATTPQGNLAAMATSIGRRIGFQKSFTEHGFVMGLVAARADLSYQQGIPRMLTRQTRFDHYWPTLSHLGEQPVYNYEIYAQGTADDIKVLGYQERYAEYRYMPSQILGSFMSTVAQPLDMWHLAQDFTSLPVLNTTFIQSNTPINRVIAVETEPHFLWDGWFQYICARPMPTYSVPGLIDHF